MKITQIDHFPLTERVTFQDFQEVENRSNQNFEKSLQGLDIKQARPHARTVKRAKVVAKDTFKFLNSALTIQQLAENAHLMGFG